MLVLLLCFSLHQLHTHFCQWPFDNHCCVCVCLLTKIQLLNFSRKFEKFASPSASLFDVVALLNVYWKSICWAFIWLLLATIRLYFDDKTFSSIEMLTVFYIYIYHIRWSANGEKLMHYHMLWWLANLLRLKSNLALTRVNYEFFQFVLFHLFVAFLAIFCLLCRMFCACVSLFFFVVVSMKRETFLIKVYCALVKANKNLYIYSTLLVFVKCELVGWKEVGEMTYYMSIYPQAIHCYGMCMSWDAFNEQSTLYIFYCVYYLWLSIVAQNGILQFIFCANSSVSGFSFAYILVFKILPTNQLLWQWHGCCELCWVSVHFNRKESKRIIKFSSRKPRLKVFHIVCLYFNVQLMR